MDLISNKAVIEECWSDLLHDYHLKITDIREHGAIIENSHTQIMMVTGKYESGFQLYLRDKTKTTENKYSVLDLIACLVKDHKYPDPSEFPEDWQQQFVFSLNYAKATLIGYFDDFLSGDFSRLDSESLFDNYLLEKEKYEKIAMQLPYGDPIKTKYRALDPTWLDDIKVRYNVE